MAQNGVQDYRRSHVTYASISLTASGNLIDYSIKDNTTLFANIKVARELIIRNTHPMFVKLNSRDNDPIEVFAREGIATSGIPVDDIFITTVAGCVVRAFMVGWN